MIINVVQDGTNVVATGSGSIDAADLTLEGGDTFSAAIAGSIAGVGVGGGPSVGVYGNSSGPSNFGTGGFTDASMGTGDDFGTCGCGGPLVLPEHYVSGSPLAGTGTWDNTTLSGLGLTTGTYTWTWGTGADADSLVVNIGNVSAVPEPASLSILGAGFAGLGLIRRRKRSQ